MVGRRLQDRILGLCEQLIVADEHGPEFQFISTELQAALKQHTLRMRAKLDRYPFANERRQRKRTRLAIITSFIRE